MLEEPFKPSFGSVNHNLKLHRNTYKCLVAGSAGLCSVAGDIEVALSDPDEPPKNL